MNSPFTEKQEKFLMAEDRRINILYGSVRSGKTWISLLKWSLWIGAQDEGCEFLMSGRTLTTLSRNCFGLLENLIGRKNFSYSIGQKRACIFGRTVWLEGASDAKAEGKIRGMTLKGAYVDEATLVPQNFFEMLLSRLSEPKAKLYCTTNPDSKSHWLKTEIIDNDNIDIAVWHFTMDDNTFLDSDYVEELKKEYTGVFYTRYISGLFCVAEGLVFRFLADDQPQYQFEQKKLSDHEIERRRHIYDVKYDRIVMGIDFGGNGSMTTFVVSGYKGWEEIDVIEEDSLPITEAIDSDDICKKFGEVYERTVNEYGHCERALGDNASTTMINTLKSYARENEYDIRVDGCLKNEIIDRAVFKDNMLSTGRMKFEKSCTKVINALSEIRWVGGKEDEIEDKNIDNINDWSDAFDYSWTMYQGYFEKRR